MIRSIGSRSVLWLAVIAALDGCGGGGDGASDSASAGPTITSNASADQSVPPGQAPAKTPTSAADAVRFLEQSSFGPTDAMVEEVKAKGAPLALEEQFYRGMSGYLNYPYIDSNQGTGCPTGSASTCARDNYSTFPVQVQFFKNATSASDQLRQRVAFALSQILVVSGLDVNKTYALARYHQMLMDNAFGNFRDLLYEVTLSPVMGEFLDMVDNPKPDPARGVQPNENYARELLQLFTVGQVKLNANGTTQNDAQGAPIPSYDQDVVLNLARAFTGWTYPTRPGATKRFKNPSNYEGRMELIDAQHDVGAKTFLNGATIAAGQSGLKDLNDALDIIFNHPNVGPFIGRQLIQHLVTSNPTPAYVARVTAKFNDNGSGVRGDMRAVLRAVLLDAEARGSIKTDAAYGKLREPALYVTGVLRGLNAQSDGVYPMQQSRSLGQDVFNSPSVFNFYPPSYTAPGSLIDGPQFKVMVTGTILNRANFANQILYTANGIAADASVAGATGTKIDITALQALAGNPDQLLDRLSALFMHDTLSAAARNAIKPAVSALVATDTAGRARAAAYLVTTSAQYQVAQ